MQAIYPGSEILEKQGKLPPGIPYDAFVDMHDLEKNLYATAGFNPLAIKIFVVRKNLDSCMLALEMALGVDTFDYNGIELLSYGLEGQGGRVFTNDPATSDQIQSGLYTGLEWLSSGFTILGDTALFTGNKITLTQLSAEAFFLVHSSSGIVERPIFRLRRAFATAVAAEILGAGTGAATEFDFTAANTPICPSSVKINFTDSGGAVVGKIRDNGQGKLVTLPPNVLLSTDKPSTIDYKTGAIFLAFSSSHIPTASNITMDYEHGGGGAPDLAEYNINWRIEG